MNLLLVAQNYHPYVGGVETHVRQVAHELRKQHRVSVAAVNFAPPRLPRRLGVLHTSMLAPHYPSHADGDVPVHALTPTLSDRLWLLPIAARALPVVPRFAYHGLSRFGYPWYRTVFQPRLRRLMGDAQVVHSLAGGYLGWTAQAVARQLGLPFVCTPFVHPGQWGDGPDDVAFYRRADAVVALLESDRGYLVSLGVPADRVRVIGVSPELPPRHDAARFRQRHGLGGAPLVLYVGRMTAAKGAPALLAAARLLWEQLPDVRVVFIGPETDESREWFRGADPRVLALGRVDLQEKADALAACDVFCMPSLSEILPTVYLEAWSLGKPVIGGLAPGLPELVEGNGGGLAVGQDPAAVAAALVCLLRDGELRARLGVQGRELVRQRYTVSAVAAALLSLYQEVAAERKTRRVS